MPKMKSSSTAKKRFKLKKNGTVSRNHAFHSHILTKKSQKRKRNLRKTSCVDKTQEKTIKQLISK